MVWMKKVEAYDTCEIAYDIDEKTCAWDENYYKSMQLPSLMNLIVFACCHCSTFIRHRPFSKLTVSLVDTFFIYFSIYIFFLTLFQSSPRQGSLALVTLPFSLAIDDSNDEVEERQVKILPILLVFWNVLLFRVHTL